MALCASSRNRRRVASVNGGSSAEVASHRTRNVPVALGNDSVCKLARPDQDPSGRQATPGAGGCGGGSLARPQAPLTSALASAPTSTRRRIRPSIVIAPWLTTWLAIVPPRRNRRDRGER